MLILIAESKTMFREQRDITESEYREHTPIYEERAAQVIEALADITVPEIREAVKVSIPLAREIQKMIYDFPHKASGLRAIDAFTGVVFRQLDIKGHSGSSIEFMNRNVRIVSSLYGWLRPDDIIKPYRFDFDTKLAPGDLSFKQFWKAKATIALVKWLKETGDCEVVDLLPKDASACIDWKIVRSMARVYKVEFKVPSGPTTMKTPPANRLKELRGKMLNQIISEKIERAADLENLEGEEFIPRGQLLHPQTFYYFSI